MRINKTLLILSVLLLWTTQGISNQVNLEIGGLTLNDVCGITRATSGADFWAVGDSGLVMKIVAGAGPDDIRIDRRFTLLSGEYDLQGVSFATPDTGWIVGYKRDNPDKWKGVILKTTNGGNNWSDIYPTVIPGLNVPFLDVYAVNVNYVWVSCGNGEVLRTRNGGQTWFRCNKPGGQSHYGWLWGIWAYDENTAWVCSDQSGLIAKTVDGGANWDVFTPEDSCSYSDVTPWMLQYNIDPQRVLFAASDGKIIHYDNGTWGSVNRLGNSCQWWRGLCYAPIEMTRYNTAVGTSGTTAGGLLVDVHKLN